jgi:hypothetical protein
MENNVPESSGGWRYAATFTFVFYQPEERPVDVSSFLRVMRELPGMTGNLFCTLYKMPTVSAVSDELNY